MNKIIFAILYFIKIATCHMYFHFSFLYKVIKVKTKKIQTNDIL